MHIIILCLMVVFISNSTVAQTPENILKGEGFVLITKESGKDIYYRPKEVKRYDGIKDKDIKPLTSLDRKMYSKLCS